MSTGGLVPLENLFDDKVDLVLRYLGEDCQRDAGTQRWLRGVTRSKYLPARRGSGHFPGILQGDSKLWLLDVPEF
jgi:hypothetical protein